MVGQLIRSDFEGEYLRQQARLCEEFTSEGFNPDRTAIPLLEEVFVPLDLSGALGSGVLVSERSQFDPALISESPISLHSDYQLQQWGTWQKTPCC